MEIVMTLADVAANTNLVKPYQSVEGPMTKIDESEIRENSIWMSFTNGDTLEFLGDGCCDQCKMIVDEHNGKWARW